MRKKLFSLLGVMVTVVAIVTFVYVQNNSLVNNVIFSANVEALAEQEAGSGKCGAPAAYEYDTNDVFMDKKNFMRCGDCSWVQGGQPVYTMC